MLYTSLPGCINMTRRLYRHDSHAASTWLACCNSITHRLYQHDSHVLSTWLRLRRHDSQAVTAWLSVCYRPDSQTVIDLTVTLYLHGHDAFCCRMLTWTISPRSPRASVAPTWRRSASARARMPSESALRPRSGWRRSVTRTLTSIWYVFLVTETRTLTSIWYVFLVT